MIPKGNDQNSSFGQECKGFFDVVLGLLQPPVPGWDEPTAGLVHIPLGTQLGCWGHPAVTDFGVCSQCHGEVAGNDRPTAQVKTSLFFFFFSQIIILI